MKKFVLLLLILVLFASGCEKTYSFDNADIIAYVENEAVLELDKEKYIDLKILLLETGINQGNHLENFELTKDEEKERKILIEKYKIENDLVEAEKYLLYDSEEKTKDYYMCFIIRNKVHEIDSDVLELTEKINMHKEYAINMHIELRFDDIRNTTDGQAIVNIEEVSKKYSISYEECTSEIFGLYIEDNLYRNYLLNYYINNVFVLDLYSIPVSDIETNVNKACTDYYTWLDALYSEANIVEKQEK